MILDVCPVCNGTKEVPITDYDKQWSWNKGKTHLPCRNCGAQYQWGNATGKVRLNKEGKPCVHKYESRTVGRCLNEYTCIHCNDRYQIDSSD